MRMTLSRWIALVVVLSATLLLAACDVAVSGPPVEAATGCQHIAFLLPGDGPSGRWERWDRPLVVASIHHYLPGARVDVADAGDSAATQQRQAANALAAGACILIVAPQDVTHAAAIVHLAALKHVPVLAYDHLIEDNSLAYFVGFDAQQVGRLQAGYIADHYHTGESVALISGPASDTAAALISTGAHDILDALAQAGEIHLLAERFTDGSSAVAQGEMADELLATGNNIQIAYAATDDLASGVIAALRAAHLGGQVLVTGSGATAAGIHNILTGDQAMTVYEPIAREADAAGQLVAELSEGASTIDPHLLNGQVQAGTGAKIPSALQVPIPVDQSNIAATVIADGALTPAGVCQGVPRGTDGVC
jgi:D-xylose transport system substrate-binding protein